MKDIIRVPTEISSENLELAYQLFLRRVQHLAELDRAYCTGMAPGQTVAYSANNCRYISDTKSSYVAGIPPVYSCAEGDAKGQAIVDLFDHQVKQQLDQALVNDASRFGRAFEACYCQTETGPDRVPRITPKSVEVSPMDAFVAYDQTLDPDSVFGAIHYVETDASNETTHYLDIYDRVNRTRYKLAGSGTTASWTIVEEPRPHGFDRVPIIEYANNPDYTGDFEGILSLQYALNEVLSDRVRDKTRFATAILVGKGVSLGDTDKEVEEMMGHIKDQEYVALQRDASLEYLVKTFDEASVQVLVDDIKGEMHKISRVPDLTDESFAANASGVAMKYKLLGLNDLAQSVVSQFDKGFKRRCKLYSYAMFGEDGADIDGMHVSFTFNAPGDVQYDATAMQIYMQNSAMSVRTMIERNPFVTDPDEEERRIEAEKDRQDERNARAEADQWQQALRGALDAEDEEPPAEGEDAELRAGPRRGGGGRAELHGRAVRQDPPRHPQGIEGPQRRRAEGPRRLQGQGRIRLSRGGPGLPP